MRATPSLAAATSSGTVSAHAIARAGPTVVTGMNVPRARAASSCSGEPGAPTPTRWQPRRAASDASAIVSAVWPDLDNAITRSVAPIQPGSWYPDTPSTWTGTAVPQIAPSASRANAAPPDPATTIARGRTSGLSWDRSV